MSRTLAAALLALSLVAAGNGAAQAAACRDAHGKFIKCPEKPATAMKKAPCKDAKGKFISCTKK